MHFFRYTYANAIILRLFFSTWISFPKINFAYSSMSKWYNLIYLLILVLLVLLVLNNITPVFILCNSFWLLWIDSLQTAMFAFFVNSAFRGLKLGLSVLPYTIMKGQTTMTSLPGRILRLMHRPTHLVLAHQPKSQQKANNKCQSTVNKTDQYKYQSNSTASLGDLVIGTAIQLVAIPT